MSLLTIRDLTIGPRNGDALVRGVDLDVEEQAAHGLVGESGSGKSLTLRAVLGLLPSGLVVHHGRVRVAGREMRRPRREGGVACVVRWWAWCRRTPR